MTPRKLVLVGAGSASFTVGLVADVLSSTREADWTIGLVDINEQALEVAQGLVRRMVQKKGVPVKVEASTDRCDLLPGADAVVTTIAVGGRKAWEDDITVPLEHGIRQPVGDTAMAGGISRALRQIPPMVEIARDVARLCPQAYFFNYSNPMAAICRALTKTGTAGSRGVVGLCHGVQGTLRYLCGLIQVPYREVSALYVGINHLTFITHLTLEGEDLWPQIRERMASLPEDENPFSWELFRTYNAFPAVLDRHAMEFFPERFGAGNYYGLTIGQDAYNILETIHNGELRFEQMARQARGEEPLEDGLFNRVLGEHEALVPILESLFGDCGEVFPMNVPNQVVPQIPAGFVLEMPVAAYQAGCLPLSLPPVPVGVAAWVTEALYGVELTVEAALQGSHELLVQALLYDRCVTDLRAATRLADDLLAAHKAHLPQFS